MQSESRALLPWKTRGFGESGKEWEHIPLWWRKDRCFETRLNVLISEDCRFTDASLSFASVSCYELCNENLGYTAFALLSVASCKLWLLSYSLVSGVRHLNNRLRRAPLLWRSLTFSLNFMTITIHSWEMGTGVYLCIDIFLIKYLWRFCFRRDKSLCRNVFLSSQWEERFETRDSMESSWRWFRFCCRYLKHEKDKSNFHFPLWYPVTLFKLAWSNVFLIRALFEDKTHPTIPKWQTSDLGPKYPRSWVITKQLNCFWFYGKRIEKNRKISMDHLVSATASVREKSCCFLTD